MPAAGEGPMTSDTIAMPGARPGGGRPGRGGAALADALAVILAGTFAFKAVLFALVGSAGYEARVARLGDGGATMGPVGSMVMAADPLTAAAGRTLRRLRD